MFGKFLREENAATLLEYIVGGALALAVLGTAAWALMNAFGTKAGETETSVGTVPGEVTAP